MDFFDSFAGPPSSESNYYLQGDFCGTIDEVTDNLRTFGRLDVVDLHRGFFADTVPSYQTPIVCLWMDVDLTTSSADVVRLLPLVAAGSCVFTHECTPDSFAGGTPVRETSLVLPPIVDAFERRGLEPAGRFLGGALGVLFDRQQGIPVLDLDAIRAIADA